MKDERTVEFAFISVVSRRMNRKLIWKSDGLIACMIVGGIEGIRGFQHEVAGDQSVCF